MEKRGIVQILKHLQQMEQYMHDYGMEQTMVVQQQETLQI